MFKHAHLKKVLSECKFLRVFYEVSCFRKGKKDVASLDG